MTEPKPEEYLTSCAKLHHSREGEETFNNKEIFYFFGHVLIGFYEHQVSVALTASEINLSHSDVLWKSLRIWRILAKHFGGGTV